MGTFDFLDFPRSRRRRCARPLGEPPVYSMLWILPTFCPETFSIRFLSFSPFPFERSPPKSFRTLSTTDYVQTPFLFMFFFSQVLHVRHRTCYDVYYGTDLLPPPLPRLSLFSPLSPACGEHISFPHVPSSLPHFDTRSRGNRGEFADQAFFC